MDWGKILRQEAAKRQEEEQRRVQRQAAPAPVSGEVNILEAVGARQLLEEIRRDVWQGVGTVERTTWYYGYPTDIQEGYGYALTFSYLYPVFKSDTKAYRNDHPNGGYGGEGDSYMEVNRRIEVQTTQKRLAILTGGRYAGSSFIFVDTRGCVERPRDKRIPLSSRMSGELQRDVANELLNILRDAVVGCYMKQDLPLQKKEKAAKEMDQYRRDGGGKLTGRSDGAWYKWMG